MDTLELKFQKLFKATKEMTENEKTQLNNREVVYQNNITSVVLMGFPNLKNIKVLLFMILFLIYCMTICGNLLVMTLSLLSKSLQSPMYFFISQLSLLDVMLSTVILPNLLYIVLYGGCTMSLTECILQFSFFTTTETCECLLLAVMSYDRYLAIYNPLRYSSIINQRFCIKSVLIIWLLAFKITLINPLSMSTLHYCGPNVIDHFYCDFEPILKLSCSDTSWIHVETFIMAFLFVAIPFLIIVISYIYIAVTVLKIPSVTGRQKAFSTCSYHLSVVFIFYGTIIFVYLFPKNGQMHIMSKLLSLFYTVITPFLNPIIYTFRNKEFKKAFEKITSNSVKFW
ncbi:PREDICTED: olfactory receptor 10A7-like [Nanorana parkeri]|uniref:olfactory receptor 10A7-like n=1 Tax=Nanorana parkeri TaxID=125878 RepID=UPI00085474C3|nr:PREDICTED: olfactory receptor 10A7-like [Nanorana parkeri]